MKRAAFGFRMHSGWGILVAVVDEREIEIIARRRIVVTNSDGALGNQPFHHMVGLGAAKAEKYLAQYRSESESVARVMICNVAKDVEARGYRLTAAAVLLASGRQLPALPQILASHPLIHTAEGELFREIIRHVCESLQIPVMGYSQRDLESITQAALGSFAVSVTQKLACAGKALGPPWTSDHKAAAMAAYLALQGIGAKAKVQISSSRQ